MKKNSYLFENFLDKESETRLLDYRAKARLEELIPTLKKSGLMEHMRVLDVGSGTGRRALEIAKFLRSGELIGIDVSQELLKEANKNLDLITEKNINFRQADIMSLKALRELGQFDFIHIRLVIQHLKDPVKALKNLTTVLKSGGSVFIEDTDRDWMAVVPSNKAWDVCYKKVKAGQKSRGGDPYSGSKLGFYLSKAGLSDVKVNLVPACGENSAVKDWLENYVPSFFIHLSVGEKIKAQKLIEQMKLKCEREPMYFYQTWFQAWGQK